MIANDIHEFSRGATFEALLGLPENVAPDFFTTWTAVSQIRQAGKLTKDGLIDDLIFEWVAPGESRQFRLINHDTAQWPLGAAELDVMFISPEGKKMRTKKFEIKITHGVTEV